MDELEPLDKDHVKVEIRVVVPGNILGDDTGLMAKYQQYLSEDDFLSSYDAEYVLLRTLQKMSRELTDKIVEKLNAKRAGSR